MPRSLTDRVDDVIDARSDPMERLARLLLVEEWLLYAEAEAANAAIAAGHSWTEIGALASTSRQAAWQRWARTESHDRDLRAGPATEAPRRRRYDRFADPWAGPVSDEDEL